MYLSTSYTEGRMYDQHRDRPKIRSNESSFGTFWTLKILILHPELNLQPWHLQQGSCVYTHTHEYKICGSPDMTKMNKTNLVKVSHLKAESLNDLQIDKSQLLSSELSLQTDFDVHSERK